MACKKKGQFKAISINLNYQHVNGMTNFDLENWSKIHARLIDTLMSKKTTTESHKEDCEFSHHKELPLHFPFKQLLKLEL